MALVNLLNIFYHVLIFRIISYILGWSLLTATNPKTFRSSTKAGIAHYRVMGFI